MKKLILSLGVLATIFLSQEVSAFNSNDYHEVTSFFESNLDEMVTSFQETHNVSWDATKVEAVTDIYDANDEKIGFLVIFDQGYIAYNNDFNVLDVSPTGYPSYYKRSFGGTPEKLVYSQGTINNEIVTPEYQSSTQTMDLYASNIYYPMEDYYLKDGFEINTSMVQIPYFKEVYDSSSWGNYQGISMSYGGLDCGGILATISLMYTLKVNGLVNLSQQDLSYQEFKRHLYFYTRFDYDSNPFTDAPILSAGINEYLNNNFGSQYSFAGIYEVDYKNPAVCLYYNNNSTATADYCMRVGSAKEPDWWIFYTTFDIVMANSMNFYVDSSGAPSMWDEWNPYPFYVVNSAYRYQMFQFFDGDNLIKL